MNEDDDAQVTPPDFPRWKLRGRKIAVLTAYDHTQARLLDSAGVDCLLVGDSLGMVVQGYDTTLHVTLDQMIYHAEMVAVPPSEPWSWSISRSAAITRGSPMPCAATRVLKETPAQAVKLEGGRRMAETVRALVDSGIPTMGHIGLMPQLIRGLGGFKVQRDGDSILADALAIADAGAFAVVLECVPIDVAKAVTESLSIPTIGIGAGVDCDGQILVAPDLLGLFDDLRPRFVRRYADLCARLRDAVASYIADVRAGRFPSEEESFR